MAETEKTKVWRAWASKHESSAALVDGKVVAVPAHLELVVWAPDGETLPAPKGSGTWVRCPWLDSDVVEMPAREDFEPPRYVSARRRDLAGEPKPVGEKVTTACTDERDGHRCGSAVGHDGCPAAARLLDRLDREKVLKAKLDAAVARADKLIDECNNLRASLASAENEVTRLKHPDPIVPKPTIAEVEMLAKQCFDEVWHPVYMAVVLDEIGRLRAQLAGAQPVPPKPSGYPFDYGLVDDVADLLHQQWCKWMAGLFHEGGSPSGVAGEDLDVPSSIVQVWQDDMTIPYAKMPECERKHNLRSEARRMLTIVGRSPALVEAKAEIEHLRAQLAGVQPSQFVIHIRGVDGKMLCGAEAKAGEGIAHGGMASATCVGCLQREGTSPACGEFRLCPRCHAHHEPPCADSTTKVIYPGTDPNGT
jgi:hypothetical protein